MSRRPVARAMIGVAALMLSPAACARGGGAAGDNYTIKFSHVTTVDTPKGRAAQRFKDIVEDRSHGRITVEIFPNSELYGDESELQALQSGAVQILAPASAKFTTIAPQLQVLDLPFLFDSPADIDKVIRPDSAVGRAIYDNPQLTARNMRVLGLWDNGFKQLSSNRRITGPGDLAGQKIRIQPSDVLRSQFEAWRAEPVPMAFADVYQAMRDGVVDGGENTWSNIESQRMHTAQRYIVESNHGYLGYVLVVNQDFLHSLPPELRDVVIAAAADSAAYNRRIAFDVNKVSKQKVIDAGTCEVSTLSRQERDAFKAAVVPAVWDQYADLIGRDLIDELLTRR